MAVGATSISARIAVTTKRWSAVPLEAWALVHGTPIAYA
jgi:hypothetical protein